VIATSSKEIQALGEVLSASGASQHGLPNWFHPQHEPTPGAQQHLPAWGLLLPNIWKGRVAARKFGSWAGNVGCEKREK